MKYYLGVDLGISGAISIVSNNGNIILCEPIPVIPVLVNKKMRNQYDITNLNGLIKAWISDYNIVKAGMERLRAFPGQSSQTGFSLGGATMLFKTLFTVYGISYRQIEPRVWQKDIFGSLGIQYDKSTTKKASILAAKQLFPNFSFRRTARCKVDSHDMCDSACIAEHLRRISN